MIRLRYFTIAGVGCALISAFGSHSIANENAAAVVAAETAIRQTGAAYVDALRRGDAKALSAAWTVNGVYVDAAGRSFQAREMIKEHFGRDAAARTTAHVTVDADSSIRFVTSDVAIEEGTFAHANTDDANAAAGSFTAIWVKKEGRWLLDNLRERDSTAKSRGNRLDPLAWMIGNWIGQGDEFEVRCAATWTENKKFIVRRFTVERDGRDVLTSTQRIGWDPGARSIRSWVFDSNGGIAEGRWRKEGAAWIVKTTGVLPDGSQSSAVNFWVPDGDDGHALKSSHVMAGDAKMKDSVVEFRRANIRP